MTTQVADNSFTELKALSCRLRQLYLCLPHMQLWFRISSNTLRWRRRMCRLQGQRITTQTWEQQKSIEQAERLATNIAHPRGYLAVDFAVQCQQKASSLPGEQVPPEAIEHPLLMPILQLQMLYKFNYEVLIVVVNVYDWFWGCFRAVLDCDAEAQKQSR